MREDKMEEGLVPDDFVWINEGKEVPGREALRHFGFGLVCHISIDTNWALCLEGPKGQGRTRLDSDHWRRVR